MKIGIVGCGHWGRNYLRVFQELRVDLAAVADADPDVRRALAERHPSLVTFPRPEPLVRDAALDAVVIATPAASHYALAAEALACDKHVLVEKPIALRAGEAERLVELAERRQRVLMVGHTFLYNDAVRLLRQIVEAPESGSIYYATSRRNHLGLIRHDVSALWDLAPHDVSILSFLLGAHPEWVSAVQGCFLRDRVGDAAFVTLGFPGGRLGQIEVSWVDAHKVREVVVVTSARRIVFDDLDPRESVRVYEKGVSADRAVESFGEFRFLLRDGDIVSPHTVQREPLRTLCSHFLDCVEKCERPLSDGAAGLEVVRVLEAAERSIAQRGEPVEVRR